MRGWIVTLLLLVALAATGCARTVTRDELARLDRDGMVETVNSWWYMGSCNGYHYLHNTRTLVTREVRIKEDQLPLKRTFLLTLNDRKWVRLPMGLYSPDDKRVESDYILSRPSLRARPADGPDGRSRAL